MTGASGKLVVISGPSGSGKTSIIERLRAHSRVRVSVSVTTRPKRPDEEEGRDYTFVDRETFKRMYEQGLFVETNDVFSNGDLYGSLWADLREALSDPDCVYIMEVDVTGAENLSATEGLEPQNIFIQPPSMEELERRLRARQTDDESAMQRRLGRAREEIERARAAGASMVVNESLERAVKAIESLVGLNEDSSAGAANPPTRHGTT